MIVTGLKLVAEKGFASVSVRDVTDAAGVSSGLMRHYFGSKDNFFQAIDDYIVEQTQDWVEWVLDGKDSREIWSRTAERPENVPLFRKYDKWVTVERPEAAAINLERTWTAIEKMVENMEEAGEIAEDVDRFWLKVLLLLIASASHLFDDFIERKLGKSPYDLDTRNASFAATMRILEHGFKDS
jgi:AcrR family transcriptional regulator|nr:TetR/AcrR family transcriptional regulator [Pseudomaricurvus alkylphenolicus]